MKILLILMLCFFTTAASAQNRIVFTRPDGGVSVVVPTPEFLAKFSTLAEGMAAVQAQSVPSNSTDVQLIDSANVLTDRTFRNAWRQSAGVIAVDMPLARDIHAGRVAAAQVAEIARLKVEERAERIKGNTSQADAHAATITALEALDLNVLATQIAAAPNPTALSAIWPAQVPR